MLGIWEYFWDEQEWLDNPPVSTSAPDVVVITVDSGSGGGDDERAPPDYWDVRANYLEYIHRPTELTHPPAPPKDIPVPAPEIFFEPQRIVVLPRLVGERANAVKRVEAALDLKTLRGSFQRLIELDRRIAVLRHQKEQLEAIEREQRRVREERRQARIKRSLAAAKKLKQLAKAYLAYVIYRSLT